MSTYCWLQRSSALYVSLVLEAQREATKGAVWELMNSLVRASFTIHSYMCPVCLHSV